MAKVIGRWAACRYCGQPKDTAVWCASEECRERVADAQAADRAHWADVFGIDPDFTGGLTADEHLTAGRGEA